MDSRVVSAFASIKAKREMAVEIEAEIARKDRLLDLFLKLQEAERHRMNIATKKSPRVKYEKMFRGVAQVVSIQNSTARLVRENGKKIRPFEITPEIAALLKRGEWLGMTAGLSQGVWRLISLDIIGTPNRTSTEVHLSVMNPAAKVQNIH